MDAFDRSEWQEVPREQPGLVEYDWVHEQKQDKPVPLAIIEAILADLDDGEPDTVPTAQ